MEKSHFFILLYNRNKCNKSMVRKLTNDLICFLFKKHKGITTFNIDGTATTYYKDDIKTVYRWKPLNKSDTQPYNEDNLVDVKLYYV